jgi:hypothetical protein
VIAIAPRRRGRLAGYNVKPASGALPRQPTLRPRCPVREPLPRSASQRLDAVFCAIRMTCECPRSAYCTFVKVRAGYMRHGGERDFRGSRARRKPAVLCRDNVWLLLLARPEADMSYFVLIILFDYLALFVIRKCLLFTIGRPFTYLLLAIVVGGCFVTAALISGNCSPPLSGRSDNVCHAN